MGRTRGAPIDGVLLLDKPEGLSSNAALQRVKRHLGAAKAGHTGTLDPMATGLLPLCLGAATKFAQGLLEADKAYLATARLGVTTDTGDREGRVLAEREVAVDAAAIDQVMHALTGNIEQVPPMYSALKHQGRPLYAIARAGGEVERAPRQVQIQRLERVDWQPPLLTFSVRCSKGTYVRTLAEQIGALLGTGAHLVALRRTAVGAFDLSEAVPLDAFLSTPPEQAPARLLAADALVLGLPAIRLGPDDAARLLQGRELPSAVCRSEAPPGLDAGPAVAPRLPADANASAAALVRVYARRSLTGAGSVGGAGADAFLGVGHLEPDGRLRAVRLIAHASVANPPESPSEVGKPAEST